MEHVPAYDHVDRQMKAGEVVRVDVGCQVDHYMGDVGRTAPVSGKFTEDSARHGICSSPAIARGSRRLRRRDAKAVYAAALTECASCPVAHHIAGQACGGDVLGPKGTEPWELHGVGLDDAEGLPAVLRAGMSVAYELMLTVDGEGFYLEDMILVKNDGYEILTPGLPYTAREIEAAMATRATARAK